MGGKSKFDLWALSLLSIEFEALIFTLGDLVFTDNKLIE